MYEQDMCLSTPGCFLFLLDQSYSMEEPFAKSKERKRDILCKSVNDWLLNLIIKSSGGSGVRDWVHVGVLGYHTDMDANPNISSAFQGSLAGKNIVPISLLDAHPARIVDLMQQIYDHDTGDMTEMPVQLPVWIDPVSLGGTPMCEVLRVAHGLLEQWIRRYPCSYPPVVIHFTDGESSDGDPVPLAEEIMSLATQDGQVLMFNCHISTTTTEDAWLFPAAEDHLPTPLARTLFRMSSLIPEPLYERASMEGFRLNSGARGFAYNADVTCVLQLLGNFGSSGPCRPL